MANETMKTMTIGEFLFEIVDAYARAQLALKIGNSELSTALSAHNTDTESHNDLRQLLQGLTDRLNALADSDDTTLDQLSEIVAYIKSNKSLIESVTTTKVNYSDIVNNLTTNLTDKALSAAQGVELKRLIDAIKVITKLSEMEDDSSHRTVTDEQIETWNAAVDKINALEDGNGVSY